MQHSFWKLTERNRNKQKIWTNEDFWLRGTGFKQTLWRLFLMHHSIRWKVTAKPALFNVLWSWLSGWRANKTELHNLEWNEGLSVIYKIQLTFWSITAHAQINKFCFYGFLSILRNGTWKMVSESGDLNLVPLSHESTRPQALRQKITEGQPHKTIFYWF